MQFPNASGVPVNMLPRSDASAFDELKALIDREPDSIAEEGWRGMLATIGSNATSPSNRTRMHAVSSIVRRRLATRCLA